MKSVMEKEQEISELRGSQDRLEEEILQLRNENLVIDKMFSSIHLLMFTNIHTYIHNHIFMLLFIYSFIHTCIHTYWYTNLLTYPILL